METINNDINLEIAIVLILVSIFSPAVSASIVYGHVKFERTDGSPDAVQNNFSLSKINGNYTLYVKNGDGENNPSSSSLIWLNGEKVVRTNEFSQNVRLITKNIPVQQTNQLEVEMRSKPGSYITLWVEDETPVIRIISPWDDTVSNEPIRISGTVTDLEISNLTLNHNGNISVIPVVNGNCSSIVNLTDINNITFNAIDSVGTLRSATLLLDGDVLPESYERLLGFDPQNPDSDASLTQENEAGNGITDGYEDFDNDGLAAYAEYKLGSDPFNKDTDGDSLEDVFELLATGTSLLKADTDGNGINDSAEDTDRGGLTNLEEQTLKTNPLNSDTDSDGLTDDVEIVLGSNPLTADSDGDGILDGVEDHTSVIRDEKLGVKVAITGKGYPAKELRIYNITSAIFTNISALVSPVLDFNLNKPFETAEITLP